MRIFLSLIFISLSFACSGTLPVKTQAYAKLHTHTVYEHDFPAVWKGIEAALRNHKILERDPSEVDPLEMKKLTERSLETDWVYSQSRDKYHEYKVNGSPRKQYLQVRYKFNLIANKVMGGAEVKVDTTEEIEKLKGDGTPDGYEASDEPNATLSNDLLEKIRVAILSNPPE